MRNISFSMTLTQLLDGSKDVTRRLGWKDLKVGSQLMACKKCMGIKKGEKIEKLGLIEVVHVSVQPLARMTELAKWGNEEAAREGFPEMSGAEFVEMFCKEMKCSADTEVTRIEFQEIREEAS